VLIPGDSTNSRLIHLVAALDKQDVMPPDAKPLSHEEVGLLRAWIDQGAKWPDGAPTCLILEANRRNATGRFSRCIRLKNHRCGMRIGRGPPIDRFILGRLESAGVRPNGRANSRQLIRRVAFDLVGLPPTPDEVREFTLAAEQDPQGALVAPGRPPLEKSALRRAAGAGTGSMSRALRRQRRAGKRS